MKKQEQLIYLNEVLINLGKYTVNVFGAGGTGSHLIDKLGALAYALRETTGKTITLRAYDFDKVSKRNVGRSDFALGDCEWDKTRIAVSKANLTYGLYWYHEEDITKFIPAHFNFICTDSAKSRTEYIEKLRTMALDEKLHGDEKPRYLFDVGNDRDFGQTVLLDLVEGKLADIDRTGLTSDTVGMETCGERPLFAEQGLFINQVMATLTAEMFWQFLTQYNLDYSQLFLNLGIMRMTTKLAWKDGV